jgi:hypothetical protein
MVFQAVPAELWCRAMAAAKRTAAFSSKPRATMTGFGANGADVISPPDQTQIDLYFRLK